MNGMPKVSVITYVYVNAVNGREPLFKECLESIAMQNYPNYEHIIIDDGSDIDIKPLVDSFPHTKYIRKEGSGILSSTYTYNLGLKVTDAKYSILLPSDDTQIDGALLGLVEGIEKKPDASMIIGKAVNEYSNGLTTIWEPNKENIENGLGIANYINGCAVMWRNSELLLSLLPPNYVGFCSDYDHWCILKKIGDVVYSDIKVVKYRQAEDSTRNKTRSNFITSPRLQDSQYFQYSKNARLEFVKDRYGLSLEEQDGSVKVMLQAEITLSNEVLFEKIVTIVEQRKWAKAHEYFVKYNDEYRQKAELLEGLIQKNSRGLIKMTTFNLTSIILMQYYKKHFFYDIVCDASSNDWLFEFLPIPFIYKITKTNDSLNDDLYNYLGLGV